MNEQDRLAIEGIFTRLDGLSRQGIERDAQAETFINDRVAQQPGSAYFLAQTVAVQDQALQAAQARITELEARSQHAGAAGTLAHPDSGVGGPPSAVTGGSSLDYSFGRKADASGTSAPANGAYGTDVHDASAPAGPSTAANAFGSSGMGKLGTRGGVAAALAGKLGFGRQGNEGENGRAPGAAPAGGGFLAGAMQTALGVTGGMMLGNMLSGLFGGNNANAATATDQAAAEADSGAHDQTEPAVDHAHQEGNLSQDVGYDQGYDDQEGGFDDGGFDDI